MKYVKILGWICVIIFSVAVIGYLIVDMWSWGSDEMQFENGMIVSVECITAGNCPDMNGDGVVDMVDFSIIASD